MRRGLHCGHIKGSFKCSSSILNCIHMTDHKPQDGPIHFWYFTHPQSLLILFGVYKLIFFFLRCLNYFLPWLIIIWHTLKAYRAHPSKMATQETKVCQPRPVTIAELQTAGFICLETLKTSHKWLASHYTMKAGQSVNVHLFVLHEHSLVNERWN